MYDAGGGRAVPYTLIYDPLEITSGTTCTFMPTRAGDNTALPNYTLTRTYGTELPQQLETTSIPGPQHWDSQHGTPPHVCAVHVRTCGQMSNRLCRQMDKHLGLLHKLVCRVATIY